MPVTTGIATNLGGTARFVSNQFSFADFTVATNGTVQTFTLPVLGQGSVIVYLRTKHSVQFAGGGLTSLLVRVGKVGGTTNFFAADFNIFQAPADGTLLEVASPAMGQLSAVTPTITFTPDAGHALSGITSGAVAIDMLIFPVTTPSFTGLYTSGSVL